ncbi:MAG: rhomboid family intramembrane serine protease [Crocinitomicaceae bacterium]
MFRSMFANMPGVVKNLVIINGLFFLATVVLENQEISLTYELGLHYPGSENFRPYQLATHFFMHAGFMHIFFNMFALIVFGSQLERVWGSKRFLLFYLITAIGASLLHIGIQVYEVYQAAGQAFPDLTVLDAGFNNRGEFMTVTDPPEYGGKSVVGQNYARPTVGASGAVYGLIAAFALLFPNTQLMLLFPPIPIKAKWLALALAAFALYSGYQRTDGDSVAHFAHLGGMIFGFILVKIWQKNSTTFY